MGISTDLGSTLPTREDDMTFEGTSVTRQREDEMTTTGVLDTEADEIVAVALPPTESDGAGEYHEVALTGSAALDVLDQVWAYIVNPLPDGKLMPGPASFAVSYECRRVDFTWKRESAMIWGGGGAMFPVGS